MKVDQYRPEARNLHERCQAFGEGQDGEVDEGADRRIVVKRDERVHLQAVQKNLDHDETRSFKLGDNSISPLPREKCGNTYGNGCSLRDEAYEVESQLSFGCQRDTARDHEHDDGELFTRLLQTEGP